MAERPAEPNRPRESEEVAELRRHLDLLLIELASLRSLPGEVAVLRERLVACENECVKSRAVQQEVAELREKLESATAMRPASPTGRAWPAVSLISWAIFVNVTALLLALLASPAHAK